MRFATDNNGFELDTACGIFIRAFGYEVFITGDDVTSGTFFDYRRYGPSWFFWAGKFHVVVSRI